MPKDHAARPWSWGGLSSGKAVVSSLVQTYQGSWRGRVRLRAIRRLVHRQDVETDLSRQVFDNHKLVIILPKKPILVREGSVPFFSFFSSSCTERACRNSLPGWHLHPF